MMTRRFVDAVIRHGWKPYQKGGWIDLNNLRAGANITFKGHENHVYRCSNKTAKDILDYAASLQNITDTSI